MNYDEFVDKFKIKKTTDDCYTPQEVYDVVLNHVGEYYVDFKSTKIVRPFFPGGNYKRAKYPSDCIVVDNPPFSIISEIVNFYEQRNIKYFLFAPTKTLFCIKSAKNYIVVGYKVVYENGANVNTSFVTNLLSDNVKIVADGVLYNKIKNLYPDKSRVKNKYPQNFLNFSRLVNLSKLGISVIIDSSHVRAVDKIGSYKVYGSGFILSNTAEQLVSAAEAAAELKVQIIDFNPQDLRVLYELNKTTQTK